MPRTPPRLQTERLVLRLPDAGDVRSILAYYHENREHLAPWEPVRTSGFYTTAYWEEQVSRAQTEFRAEASVRLFVFLRDRPRDMVAYIGFTGVTRGVAQFCFMGYSIASQHEGTGLMTEAADAAVDYMFRGIRLHRIMANYMPRNRRSARLLERLGFVVEGYARDYLQINGRWEDHVLAAKTNPHWDSWRRR